MLIETLYLLFIEYPEFLFYFLLQNHNYVDILFNVGSNKLLLLYFHMQQLLHFYKHTRIYIKKTKYEIQLPQSSTWWYITA